MAYNFSRINLKCDKFAFLIGYYVTLRYHKFFKQEKRLFIQYGVPNVTEAFRFDVSIHISRRNKRSVLTVFGCVYINVFGHLLSLVLFLLALTYSN